MSLWNSEVKLRISLKGFADKPNFTTNKFKWRGLLALRIRWPADDLQLPL